MLNEPKVVFAIPEYESQGPRVRCTNAVQKWVGFASIVKQLVNLNESCCDVRMAYSTDLREKVM